jgi:succinoglycan biosynthesis protein ExoA
MPSSDAAATPPMVSVVIPCRQEAALIGEMIASVLATEYDRDRLEILVVDGMSDDGTREIVARAAAADPVVRLLDNPGRVIPSALNLGIAAARGDVIVRMDAHTTYPPDYVRRCVEGLIATGADNVGGACVTLPREQTLQARAYATVLSHPFGIGNAHYKLGVSAPLEVDAVPFGCMWRRTMLELGPYDERIARSEDFGFNARLRARGGRMLLLPGIVSYYHARSRLGPFVAHSASNGYWIAYPLAFGGLRFSLRHYVPLLFVLGLVGPALLAIRWPVALWPTAAAAGAYAVASVAAAIHAARREGSPALLAVLPPVFLLLHVTYGVGSAWGLMCAGWRRLRDYRARPRIPYPAPNDGRPPAP